MVRECRWQLTLRPRRFLGRGGLLLRRDTRRRRVRSLRGQRDASGATTGRCKRQRRLLGSTERADSARLPRLYAREAGKRRRVPELPPELRVRQVAAEREDPDERLERLALDPA